MRRPLASLPIATLAIVFLPLSSAAQTFEAVGTRAAGMGGAFVAVADDSSAVYWNPAGLATGGALFGVIVDTGLSQADPDNQLNGGKQSATLVAMSTPPLGASYYRLSMTRVSPVLTVQPVAANRFERLTTHHAGVTFVQSVASAIAVASTLKAVRGVATSGTLIGFDRDDLLDDGIDLPEQASTHFSADVGVMARVGGTRVGVTVRNVTEPDFETPDGGAIELKRQSRAGVAFVGAPGVILAADVDLERVRGLLGDVRNVAGGAELMLSPRAFVRGGVRFNTLSEDVGGHAPVGTVGGTFAIFRSILVDAQVTFGSSSGNRGWGVAGRFVY